jgi:hypothetical protein
MSLIGRQDRMGPHDKGATNDHCWNLCMSAMLAGRSRRRRSCWPCHGVRRSHPLGPRAQDRVASTHCYVNAMLPFAFGIRSGSTLYFESALIVGLLGL